MLKEKPTMPNRLKDRLSSVYVSIELSRKDLSCCTLLIAEVCELGIFGDSFVDSVMPTRLQK
jgi:hypothetical protein